MKSIGTTFRYLSAPSWASVRVEVAATAVDAEERDYMITSTLTERVFSTAGDTVILCQKDNEFVIGQLHDVWCCLCVRTEQEGRGFERETERERERETNNTLER